MTLTASSALRNFKSNSRRITSRRRDNLWAVRAAASRRNRPPYFFTRSLCARNLNIRMNILATRLACEKTREEKKGTNVECKKRRNTQTECAPFREKRARVRRYFSQSLHLILFAITLTLRRVCDSEMKIMRNTATPIAVAIRNCSENSVSKSGDATRRNTRYMFDTQFLMEESCAR